MQESFPSVIFNSSLALEGILFGALGFFYTVYVTYTAAITPARPAPPHIAGELRPLCLLTEVLIVINSLARIIHRCDLR